MRPDENQNYAVTAGEKYVVLPEHVVDTSDSEPEEYSPGNVLSMKRVNQINQARRETIEKFYVRKHPDIFTFDMVSIFAFFLNSFYLFNLVFFKSPFYTHNFDSRQVSQSSFFFFSASTSFVI